MLTLTNIQKTFAPGTVNEKKALCGIDLHLDAGDFVTVLGSNGAGKSTLFGAIAGSFRPDTGTVVLDRAEFRDRLAALELGLEDRMNHPVGLLSGGQRQALTLLMATLVTPKLLLLDEHTAALDPATAEKVLELTKKIVAENHITCLMITHNVPSALALGNRTVMMKDGRIVLELAGAQRANMTPEDLLKAFHVESDRMLFIAE